MRAMPTAKLDDVSIYYELHGSGAATPAVLVQGLGTDAHGWERVLPALSASRRVLVLDNRGIGRSSKPRGPYTTALLADDLARVMSEAGIERAHVAGLSLGGMISQELALRHPARLQSLALLATYAKPDADTLSTADEGAAAGTGAGQNLGSMMKSMSDGKISIDFAQLFGFLMPRVFSPTFLMNESAYLAKFYARSMEYGLSPDGFGGQVAAALGHDTASRLGSITAPTLVVTGTADRLIPPRHAAAMASAIPGARLIEIEGAPHGLNFEASERVIDVLGSWFAEND
jgi:3-oxoadipate enol-lactonase